MPGCAVSKATTDTIAAIKPELDGHPARRRGCYAAIAAAAWRCLPSLPLLVGLAAFIRALAEPRALLNDPDTYLHIAAGRWMLARGALPAADPFSHTMAGGHWAVPEWLAEIVLAATYDAAGWGAVVVLTALSFAAAFAILTRYLLRRLDPLPSLVTALAGVALALPHLVARPHVLALPLLAAWSGGLLAARDSGKRPPWQLLALMPLWANLHGSFLFGFALAAFAAGEAVLWPSVGRSRGEELHRWGWFGAAVLGAALLTPNGVAGLVAPLRLMAMPTLQASFGEWMPSNLAEFPALELWLVGALALGFAAGARLPFSRLALLVALVHMALRHVRHADLLALVGPLVVVGTLGPAISERLRSASSSALSRCFARLAAPVRLPGIATTLVVVAAIAWPTLARPLDRADDPVTPASAVAAAKRFGLSGAVFNAERFGGYLVFVGVPSFIDGRIEMYGDQFLASAIIAEGGDEAALRALPKHGVTWTLLPPESGAAAALDRLPGWRRLYADDYAVVHAWDPSAPH